MTLPYFTLSCDSFKQNIFSGFIHLQEQQEFVDLTLAADGHIVKVHKNIMALASPYIRAILKTAPSDNPVIFLNNVSHKVLRYLLEYIYQGEVNVPRESLESFMQASQSLHITGIANQNTSKTSKNSFPEESGNQNTETNIVQQQDQICPTSTIQLQDTFLNNESTSNVAACITINNDHNFEVQQIDNIPISNGSNPNLNNGGTHIFTTEAIQAMPIVLNSENAAGNIITENPTNMEMDVTLPQGDDANATIETKANYSTMEILSDIKIKPGEATLIDLNSLDKESADALKIITQYTTSERGAVQIIVSRYIYCCHHTSRRGQKHRWRCIDYRKEQCKAYIDSFDGRIITRKGLHNHTFHDERIYKKYKMGRIFTSYAQAKEAWSKGQDVNTEDMLHVSE